MIWIIIPAYNEGRNLPGVMHDIVGALGNTPYRAFIINDGSRDDTLSVAHALAKDFPIEVLNHAVNRGVAEVFRTGITRAASLAQPDEPIIIMEGDGTSDPSLILPMARRIKAGTDLVIASRYCAGGRYQGFPLKRLILSKGANIVFRVLFPVQKVRDYSIFYRAYRAGCLQDALAHFGQKFITVQTFFANIEILLHLVPYLTRVEEIPLIYDYGKKQGKSGMKVWKNLRSYLSFIIHHAFRSTI